jgi:hypothetical protein
MCDRRPRPSPISTVRSRKIRGPPPPPQIHAHFLKFRSEFRDFNADPVQAPLCIAWYSDGKKEFVNSQTLLMLMKHREWRVQLTALQAYIHPLRNARGHFSSVHQVRIGADDITDKNAALDIVTKSLAAYSEKAYAVTGESGPDDEMQSIATPPTLPTSNIKVDSMDAEFIFDENEKLWFSHLSSVMVQVVHAKRERNQVRAQQREAPLSFPPPSSNPPPPPRSLSCDQELKRMEESKVIEAASVVAAELRRLLRMASNRGVSVSASFAHFDTQGVGYADCPNLVEGLARLGIGVSQPAAEMLMSMIGTASSLHFRAKDLVLFAELEDDDKDGSVTEDGFPDEDSNSASRSRTASPQPRPRKQRKQAFEKDDSTVDSKPGTPLDLDYTVSAPPPKEDLPRWARNKSKKAYGELKQAEVRYKKNQANKDQFQSYARTAPFPPPPHAPAHCFARRYEDDLSSDDEKPSTAASKKPPGTADSGVNITFPDENDADAVGAPSATNEAENNSVSQGSLASLSVSLSVQSSNPSLSLPVGEGPIPEDDDIDLSDADSLFHAHSSIVMSYRVLNAANRPAASKKTEATVLQQSAAYVALDKVAHLSPVSPLFLQVPRGAGDHGASKPAEGDPLPARGHAGHLHDPRHARDGLRPPSRPAPQVLHPPRRTPWPPQHSVAQGRGPQQRDPRGMPVQPSAPRLDQRRVRAGASDPQLLHRLRLRRGLSHDLCFRPAQRPEQRGFQEDAQDHDPRQLLLQGEPPPARAKRAQQRFRGKVAR